MYEIQKWTKQPTNVRTKATNYEQTKVQMYEIRKWTKQPTNVRINQPKVWTTTMNVV